LRPATEKRYAAHVSQAESIPSVAQLQLHAGHTALIADDGQLRHQDLLEASARAATALLAGSTDLAEARVCFLVPPSAAYVTTLFGIWRAGGIAVPLCVTHPAPELEHVLDDAQAQIVVVHPELEATLAPLAQKRKLRCVLTTEVQAAAVGRLPQVEPSRAALLIYTSGTTGKPKGALSTHAILQAQMRSIGEAWELSSSDRILHVLPLHHLHGILNALLSVLFAGGSCELLPRFDAARVWARLLESRELSLFMAVPTIYSKLAAAWDAADASQQRAMTAACQRLRLMVSGSAALPVSMLQRWQAISRHQLLERYGMTEIGMGLGNPLRGERRPGCVGVPFPGVQARLVDDAGCVLADDTPGQLEICGPNVFREYWNKPEASAAVFTADGWFKTGDVAVRERGYYRLLGRESVDILKTGGYKVSALEIEEALREHPAIAEVCVVGVADDEWGQRVAAAVVLHGGAELGLPELRAFCKDRIAPYKTPSLLLTVRELPRNAMGKLQKREVARLFDVARQH
jgi:malonyl-CoA/methylmalonyl-CoA synthetase